MSKMGQHVQQLQQEIMDDLDDLSRFCENYRVWSEELTQEAIEQKDSEAKLSEAKLSEAKLAQQDKEMNRGESDA